MNNFTALSFLTRVGSTVIFYVPADKVDMLRYGRHERTPSRLMEEFFIEHFGGFTHEESHIQGHWVGSQGKIVTDRHQRYEVSVDGSDNAAKLFRCLSEICGMLEEESIYATYKSDTWLIGKMKSLEPDTFATPTIVPSLRTTK